MITGSNDVYTPVNAYGVTTFADSMISGGTGGDATSTQGVRFIWVYDPKTPKSNPSGFTGGGWFEETEGTPIWYSASQFNLTLDDIINDFKSGVRINLNDVFKNWQSYVDAQGSLGKDVLQDFQYTVPRGCWTNLQ